MDVNRARYTCRCALLRELSYMGWVRTSEEKFTHSLGKNYCIMFDPEVESYVDEIVGGRTIDSVRKEIMAGFEITEADVPAPVYHRHREFWGNCTTVKSIFPPWDAKNPPKIDYKIVRPGRFDPPARITRITEKIEQHGCPRCNHSACVIASDKNPCARCGYPGLKSITGDCRHGVLRKKYDGDIECLEDGCKAVFKTEFIIASNTKLRRGPDLIHGTRAIWPTDGAIEDVFWVIKDDMSGPIFGITPKNKAAKPPRSGYGFKTNV